MRVLILRHGQTDFNFEGRMQGQIDIPLNATGIAQAQEVAPLIALQQPVAVISSPLKRARQTAEIVAQACGLSVEIDDRLIERGFGRLEGMTREEMKARQPQLYAQWRSNAHADGVESRREVGDRIAACIRDTATRIEGEFAAKTSEDLNKAFDLDLGCDRELTVVLVTHGSAMANGIAMLLGIDPTTWSGLRGANNCNWSVVVPAQREPGWRLVEHNTRTVHGGAELVSKG